jgi:signal transduction histidine kinase
VQKVRSLRFRFVLAISLLVALVLVANGLILALASRRQLREDIERRAQAYAQLSVGPICNAYETYYSSGYSKFRELLLETIKLDPDLDRLEIYDTNGHPIFDSSEFQSELVEPAQPSSRVTSDPILARAVRGMAPAAWSAMADRKPSYIVVAPFVEDWGRHRYSVVFHFTYDGVQVAAKAAGRRIIWLATGSLALGVAIAILLSAQSMGPLRLLTRGAQDLADGHLARRIELTTGDEFGVLANTFNQMAETLARTISDLETSNRTLGDLNVELQQLDRLKSDLLANVSHELRTPLTAIRGFTEAMDQELLGTLNDQQHEALKVVDRNTRRLIGMIEQLLSFSRLEAGLSAVDLAAFDLAELTAQVAGSARAAHGPDLNLQLDVEPKLPPVWADPGRIAQVIENLLTNAVKFTPPGGFIRVVLRRREREVEVRVIDRGIGISAAALPRIFDRFYQADGSSTRRYGGMGLGLAIVREILAAHGREIQVESQLGVGTTFHFTLPLAVEPTDEIANSLWNDAAARPAGDAGGAKS